MELPRTEPFLRSGLPISKWQGETTRRVSIHRVLVKHQTSAKCVGEIDEVSNSLFPEQFYEHGCCRRTKSSVEYDGQNA
jgi:hypothetical protein